MFKGISEWWKEVVRAMNARGIPMPTIRDPKTGLGSISLTLVFLSFNVWLLSVIGKVAGVLGGMNPDQCLNMFIACASLYFGRKMQIDGTKRSLDEKTDTESK